MTSLVQPPYAMDALTPLLGSELLCLIYQKILPSYKKHLPNTVETLPALTDFLMNHTEHRYATELYQHLFWLHHLALDTHRIPSDFMKDKIYQAFGSFDKFLHEFTKPLNDADGLDYRWLWLISENGKLTTIATKTQSILSLGKPILGCNLWQHAYLYEYQDRTRDYITAFFERLVDWQKCEQNYQDTRIWGSY